MEDFGPYRIVRRIATGGMAEVFLARQRGIEGLERTVVIKRVLPAYGTNEEFVTMFLDEARLLAGLNHPNIAQVFDLGRTEETYYLVMEHVRGPTLGAILQASERAGHTGLPQRQALGIALQIAEALAYLHERKDELGRPLDIVHRDLNPANVIIAYTGAIKLIDFGIAKAASKVHETRTGVIKGTDGYIAPEQHRPGKVDHRADVYALGVLLYEMLVGRHPFSNKLVEPAGTAWTSPRDIVPSVSESLDGIIARCLHRDPEKRPSNVRSLIREIAQGTENAGFVVTMSDVADLLEELLPDSEGHTPLRPLHPTGPHAPDNKSPTVQLPGANYAKRARSTEASSVEDDDGATTEFDIEDMAGRGESFDEPAPSSALAVGTRQQAPDDAPTAHRRLPESQTQPAAGGRDAPRAATHRHSPPARNEPSARSRDEESDWSIAATAPRRPLSSSEAAATTSSHPETPGSPPRRSAGAPSGSARGSNPPSGAKEHSPTWVGRWKRGALAAIVLGVAGSVGVAAFVTTRSLRRAHSSPPSRAAAGGAAVQNGQAPHDAGTSAAPERLHVVSEPSGATVAVNGQAVGSTPTEVNVPPKRDRLWVRVSLDGYVTAERPVQATAGEARFVLEPLQVDAGAHGGAAVP